MNVGERGESEQRASTTRRLLVGFALPYRRVLLLAVVASLGAGMAQTVQVFIPEVFLDHVLGDSPPDAASGIAMWFRDTAKAWSPGSSDRMAMATLLAMVVTGAGIIAALTRYANECLAKYLATAVVKDLRVALLHRVVRLPMARFDGDRMGDLVSRFSNDIQTTYLTINIFLSELMFQPFVLLGAVVGAFAVSWQLATCALVSFPIVSLPVILLGKAVQRRSRRTLVSLGDATETLTQVLSGMRVVRSYQQESAEVRRYTAVNDRWVRQQVALVRVKARAKAIMDGVHALLLGAILWGGTWLVVHERWNLTAAKLLSFITALALMYRPLRRLSEAYQRWRTSLAAAARVFDVMDAPSVTPDRAGAESCGPIRQGIRFDNVSFAYSDGPPVLWGVSFELPAGTTTALVGPSGAGKSTIGDLIFRFYEPTSGTITVDGAPSDSVTRESLIRQFATVSQQPFLFHATVRENIAYGRPDATDADVEAAARAAAIHDDILRNPGGYDALVGDRGARLSGGQLQRITMARAILANPSFLLLDEATSNLDAESERIIQGALQNLLRDRTSLVIAHRLSTVRHADQILVLEAGHIVERGTHEELLASNGLYRRLHDTQWGLDDR